MWTERAQKKIQYAILHRIACLHDGTFTVYVNKGLFIFSWFRAIHISIDEGIFFLMRYELFNFFLEFQKNISHLKNFYWVLFVLADIFSDRYSDIYTFCVNAQSFRIPLNSLIREKIFLHIGRLHVKSSFHSTS